MRGEVGDMIPPDHLSDPPVARQVAKPASVRWRCRGQDQRRDDWRDRSSRRAGGRSRRELRKSRTGKNSGPSATSAIKAPRFDFAEGSLGALSRARRHPLARLRPCPWRTPRESFFDSVCRLSCSLPGDISGGLGGCIDQCYDPQPSPQFPPHSPHKSRDSAGFRVAWSDRAGWRVTWSDATTVHRG